MGEFIWHNYRWHIDLVVFSCTYAIHLFVFLLFFFHLLNFHVILKALWRGDYKWSFNLDAVSLTNERCHKNIKKKAHCLPSNVVTVVLTRPLGVVPMQKKNKYNSWMEAIIMSHPLHVPHTDCSTIWSQMIN